MVSERITEVPQIEPLDIRGLLKRYAARWYVFLIAAFIGVLAAFIYNKEQLPVYNVSTTVLINEQENNLAPQPTGIANAFNLFSTGGNFENEIYILKSTPVIESALSSLNFNVSYYERRIFNSKELYELSPFVVVFDKNHPQPIDVDFKMDFVDDKRFIITAVSNDVTIYDYATNKSIDKIDNLKLHKMVAFGSPINSEYYNFKVILNQNFISKELKNKNYYFRFNSLRSLTYQYQNLINIEPVQENADLARITLKATNVKKAIDLLGNLTEEYINRSLDKRNYISVNTSNYIDGQLRRITDSLTNTEKKLQNYQANNEVMDINAKSTRLYDQLQDLQNQKENIEIRNRYYNYINNYFVTNQNISDMIAPSSMGIEDPLLNNMIQELTNLSNEKKNLITNKQEKSPYLRQLNVKIENLKNTIFENIKYVQNTTKLTLEDIDNKINGLYREIGKLPKTSRELVGIERKFNVNDAIYTYLLQRKAESEISKASSLPNIEIVEPPDQAGELPVAPKKNLNYLLAFLLSIVIPAGYFGITDFFNETIKDERSFEKYIKFPFIGKVLHNYHRTEDILFRYPGSSTSESFRQIRTNLQFFNKGKPNQVILVTSSFSGEGKTFVALNIAAALSLSGKKTVLVDFDLRKSRLSDVFFEKNTYGVSSYLINSVLFEDIIMSNSNENLHFISSGEIPPNPVELIDSEKTRQLFSNLTDNYDYVVVDTPPLGIVADPFLIMQYSTINILVVRNNYTSLREFISVQKDLVNKKIANLCILVNDVRLKGGKYGHDYYSKKTSKHTEKRSSHQLSHKLSS